MQLCIVPNVSAYAKLGDGDVQHAADHDQSIERVPRIDEVVLHQRGRRRKSKLAWVHSVRAEGRGKKKNSHEHEEPVAWWSSQWWTPPWRSCWGCPWWRWTAWTARNAWGEATHGWEPPTDWLLVHCVQVRPCGLIPEQPGSACFPGSAQTWHIQTGWSWWFSRTSVEMDF